MRTFILESGIETTTPQTQEFFGKAKKFNIKVSLGKKVATFIDVDDPTNTLITTTLKNFQQVVDSFCQRYVEFHTQNSIIKVWSLDEPDAPTFSVKEDYHRVNFGDGWYKYSYTFSHPLSKAEFLAFCGKQHPEYQNFSPKGWWEEYDKIEGNGTKWTLTHVLPYLD